MTKSYNTIQNILQNKGENLNQNDIKLIRNEYPLLSIEELENIGYIEEIIEQIQITPQNQDL